jgi:m7GpppX diphosphatase
MRNPIQLELEPETGPSIMERRTFTYGIGTKHGLYPGLSAATASSAV